MASTYSPTLRIELIGTGDQSGLWGDTTNNNLGALIEQAITGIQAIPMTDTDYTLSALNGSVDESRNAVIIMTSVGSLTATRSVFIPEVEKTYAFRNATTGGQSITVQTAAGAGLTIPNGKTIILYCDGTDCFQAADYFNSLTANNATATNATITNLTATNLTLGSGTTGTGSYVRQDSPTITTPTINTPTINTPTIVTPSISNATLTGVPTAPTAASGTNTTQVATTAFALANGLPLGATGFGVRTDNSTTTLRSITAGTGISVTNGDGVSGNPSIANTGVTALAGATGITASASTGSITVSPTSGYNGYGARTVSSSAPSGGSNGDIWYQV